jgi:hypothetical protein
METTAFLAGVLAGMALLDVWRRAATRPRRR